MRDIFRGFGAVFYKETLHVRRDAGTLFFSLTMPRSHLFLSIIRLNWSAFDLAGTDGFSAFQGSL